MKHPTEVEVTLESHTLCDKCNEHIKPPMFVIAVMQDSCVKKIKMIGV